MKLLTSWLRKFARTETGSATIEFVIVFPVFMSILGSAIEAGVLTSRQVMLERATDLAVRDLRLGRANVSTSDELKSRICSLAGVIPDCTNALHIELTPVSTDTWEMRTGRFACIDRDEDITPVTTYKQGAANELMLVRVCAVVRPINPMAGLGLQLPKVNASDYALVAASAFVNEPA